MTGGGPAGGGLRPDPAAAWTVRQVNEAARGLLEREAPSLWVRGETANVYQARSGHWYFTLKDAGAGAGAEAEIGCVLFQWDARRLAAPPQAGMGVRVLGGLTLYEPKGRFQLRVRRLVADGADGAWRRRFEELRRRLEREGLIDPGRRRPLPRFPRTVGVVTSPSGAALRDVASVLRRRAPWVRLLLRGTRVQGEGAAAEIADALRVIGARRPDVIVVARGGGSEEDLWSFNEEVVARAVAASPAPVVSGVGHETDVTICDLVADLRAPTPSAAAEAVAPDRATVAQRLDERAGRMAKGLAGKARLARARLEAGRRGLGRRGRRLGEAPRRRLDGQRQRLAAAARRRVALEGTRLAGMRSRLGGASRARIGSARERARRGEREMRAGVAALARTRTAALERAAAALDALSPLGTLQRGYAIPLDADGSALRRAGDFEPGLRFTLRVADGAVPCRVRADGPGGGDAGGGE